MIELKGVSKYYNNNGVVSSGLRNVSLTFSTNEIVAITGDSGSGKSTLLNVIAKTDTFDDGEILFMGNETSHFNIDDMDEFRKNKVGFIFQDYNIIDSYTVLENVMLPLILKGLTKKEAKEKALSLIKEVGLENRINNRGTKLSGGEKQRCVIARALAMDCSILACDEPTGNLDSKTGKEILELIKKVSKDKLVLIVTHNYQEVADIATRKIHIADGEVIEDQIFSFQENDLDEELELEYTMMSKKIKARISKNNLLYTPNKTILTFFVLFFISFFALALYQSIYTENVESNVTNSYFYNGDNKIMVYSKDHQPLDLEKLAKISDTIKFNQFYQVESGVRFTTSDDFEINASYEPYAKDLMADDGRLPITADEVFLLIPKDSYLSYYVDQIIDKNITEYNSKKAFKVVGVQYRSDISRPIFTENIELEKLFQNSYYRSVANNVVFNFKNDTKDEIHVAFGNFDEIKLYAPARYKNTAITYTVSEIYEFELSEVTFQELDYVSLLIPYDYDFSSDTVYEASLYGNTKKMEKLAKAYGYEVENVKTFSTYKGVELDKILSYFLIALSSIVIVILYFISYIVLSRIYQSKKKDYTVLRTLGITRKDMGSIITYEMVSLAGLSAIIIYIVMVILGFSINNSFLNIFKNVTFITTILYFAVMLIFGYFVSRRFNKRLFKYSVKKTLSSGVMEND